MKKLRRVGLIILPLILMTILTACGSDKVADMKSGDIKFAEVSSKDTETVFYYVLNEKQAVAKDTHVDGIVITKGGKSISYATPIERLSEVSKLSIDQLKKKALKWDKAEYKEEMENWDDWNGKKPKYSEPKWVKTKITAKTDDTGNNIAKETFDFQRVSITDFNTPMTPMVVLDKTFVGFQEDGDYALITEVPKGSKAEVKFDDKKTKGIKIDD